MVASNSPERRERPLSGLTTSIRVQSNSPAAIEKPSEITVADRHVFANSRKPLVSVASNENGIARMPIGSITRPLQSVQSNGWKEARHASHRNRPQRSHVPIEPASGCEGQTAVETTALIAEPPRSA